MSRQWSDSTKRSVTIALAIVFVVVLYRFNDILPPLIIAVIIAYILTPVVDYLNRRTPVPRSLCVLVVDLAALALVAVIPAVAAPALISELAEVDINTQFLIDSLSRYMSSGPTLWGYRLDLDQLLDRLSSSLQGAVSPLLSQGLFFLIDIATGVLWVIFVFVVSFYLMRDWHRMTRYLSSIVPADYKADYANLTARFARVWQSFFRGQVILSLVVGTVVASTTAIVGLSNALVLGLLAGLLEVIPNFGPVIAAVPAVALALFKGSSWLPIGNFWFALLVVGLYILIQQVENNYLVPRIIGSSVELHPMVVLVGAIAGAGLAGVLGIFLAAPVLASARAVLAYVYAKLLDVDPFPESSEELPPPAPAARRYARSPVGFLRSITRLLRRG